MNRRALLSLTGLAAAVALVRPSIDGDLAWRCVMCRTVAAGESPPVRCPKCEGGLWVKSRDVDAAVAWWT